MKSSLFGNFLPVLILCVTGRSAHLPLFGGLASLLVAVVCAAGQMGIVLVIARPCPFAPLPIRGGMLVWPRVLGGVVGIGLVLTQWIAHT